ncbi:MAG TPA: D-alanine--D-alanine ligase [Patescibacteria group bacterium]
MSEKKVTFLFGGPGSEREVSVATAKSALPSFDDQFRIQPVFITPDRRWVVSENYVAPGEAWDVAMRLMTQSAVPSDIALETIETSSPDVVFIGLHGEYGEDGTVQALLEARGLAYTGSNSEASALAMDKPKVLQILQDEDLLVPEFLEVTPEVTPSDVQAFADFNGYPLVVLPADRGSSVGVTIVKQSEDLDSAIEQARTKSDRVMVTKYIAGQEVSCGLLVTDKNELTALPVTDLNPIEGHDFFDYDAKYLAGECDEVTPSRLPEDVQTNVQEIARKVHQLLGADGYSRVDMIVTPNHEVYVLELNTLPGMTQTSIIPQQAKVHGLSFSELLATICNNIDRSNEDYLTFED